MRDNSSRPSVRYRRPLLGRWKKDKRPARRNSAEYSISRSACTWRHCGAIRRSHREAKCSRVGLEAGTGQRKKNVLKIGRTNSDGAPGALVLPATAREHDGGV